MAKIKTGEVNWRDEDGKLYLCESFQDEETGEVTSSKTLIPEEVVDAPIEQQAAVLDVQTNLE